MGKARLALIPQGLSEVQLKPLAGLLKNYMKRFHGKQAMRYKDGGLPQLHAR